MATAAKIDHKRELGTLYRAHPEPAVVVVPELGFLAIDGHGTPEGPAFAEAMQALYAIAYGAKFAVKRGAAGIDFTVMPLEGLWWAPDMAVFTSGDKSAWDWRLLIMQPDVVTAEVVEAARAAVAKKRPLDALGAVRLERFAEGRAAQLLHVGPYSEEAPAIARLHAFIAEQGGEPTGKHHEIYLGDPRRTAPEKLRTILRQPFA